MGDPVGQPSLGATGVVVTVVVLLLTCLRVLGRRFTSACLASACMHFCLSLLACAPSFASERQLLVRNTKQKNKNVVLARCRCAGTYPFGLLALCVMLFPLYQYGPPCYGLGTACNGRKRPR